MMQAEDVGVTIKGYTLMECIGGGAFGRVYKSIRMDSPNFFAIKVVKKNPPGSSQAKLRKLRKLLQTEIEAMRVCDSSNVVRLIERFDSATKIYIVLQFCDGPDLQKYMKQKKVLPEQEALIILRQLACGFQELQRHKIIHRDLKPANIFSNGGEFKIGDLGFARVLERTGDLTSTMLGSLCYMAPEILQNQKYGFPVDIWSLGIVLHQMVTGKRPFGNPFIADFGTMYYEIKKTELTFEGVNISQQLQDLIRWMLIIDPHKRITWEEFYEHPLLRKDDLLVSIGLPVVRRQTSKKDKPKNTKKLESVYEDVFEQLNKEEDVKEFDDTGVPKQIPAKNQTAQKVEDMRRLYQSMEEINRECKLYTEQILFELGKLNLLLKYLVVIEDVQLKQQLEKSRKLTEVRLMVAHRCMRKAEAITKYFVEDPNAAKKKSVILSDRPELFKFKYDVQYRKTPDFLNLYAQYKFIYEKCKVYYDEVSLILKVHEDRKVNMLVDFVKKFSDGQNQSKKIAILDGIEYGDFTPQEHTEFTLKYLHERKDRYDKVEPCAALYIYLYLMSHYRQLAAFGGANNLVANLKEEIDRVSGLRLPTKQWKENIQKIKSQL